MLAEKQNRLFFVSALSSQQNNFWQSVPSDKVRYQELELISCKIKAAKSWIAIEIYFINIIYSSKKFRNLIATIVI